jgi:MoaA/NifB/PqqE/SkfB family radical SAM enzyme
MNLNYVNINVECTDLCNMHCIMCNQHDGRGFMHGNNCKSSFLPLADFIKLLNDIQNSKLEVGSFTPQWSGESTYHPDFKVFMKMLFEQNKEKPFFKRFIFNSNGLAFDKEVSDIFLDYANYIKENKLGEYEFNVMFSLDAVTGKTFEEIKCINSYFYLEVLQNIDYLVTKRTSMGLIMPNLTFSFVIMKENVHEASVFLDYWRNYLQGRGLAFGITTEIRFPRENDDIFIRTCDDSRQEHAIENIRIKQNFVEKMGLAEARLNKQDSQLSHISPDKGKRRPCFQLWNMCIISRSGVMTPCCKDNFFQLSLGNIKDMTIEEMWLGDKLKQLRLAHIKGEFDQCGICSNCINPPGGYMKDEDIVAYLNLINEPEVIDYYINRVHKEESFV